MKERKPRGYWKDICNVILEIEFVKSEHGFDRIPSQKELQRLSYSGLSRAIIDYYGGFRKFRELMGEEQRRIEDNKWANLDYVVVEVRKVMEKHDFSEFPSQNKLQRLSYYGIINAIHRYHGGFRQFRKSLGQDQRKIEDGLWKDLEYVIERTKNVMETHNLQTLPCGKKLMEIRESSLGDAMVKYHGGFRKFRQILGQKQKRTQFGLWKDLEYVLTHVEKVMQRHGFTELPGAERLKDVNEGALASAIIKYHGGFRKFRELLGEDQREKPKGYWKNIENLIFEVEKAMKKEEWNNLPKTSKLKELGYNQIVNAICKYHGGLLALRELLRQRQGIPSEREQLEGLLEEYVGGEAC